MGKRKHVADDSFLDSLQLLALLDDPEAVVRSKLIPLKPLITKRLKVNQAHSTAYPSHSSPKPESMKPAKETASVVDIQRLEYNTRSFQKVLNTIVRTPLERPLTKNDLDSSELLKLASLIQKVYGQEGTKTAEDDHNERSTVVRATFDSVLNCDTSPETWAKIEAANAGVDVPRSAEPVVDGPTASFSPPPPRAPGLPELPEVKDRKLYERVFIHRSLLSHKFYLAQLEMLNTHNERLEFLGDLVLNNLTTLIIYDRYPKALEGVLTRIRSSLIDNKTLTQFAIAYGFDKLLKTQIDQEVLEAGDQKVYADAFEAYVGALALENGLDFKIIKDWLHQLYEPKLAQLDSDDNLTPINKEAKLELYLLVGSALMHPEYVIAQKGDGVHQPYVVECRINNELLGVGSASNTRDAGLRAAMDALNNRELVEKYFTMRSKADPLVSMVTPYAAESARKESEEPVDADKSISDGLFPLPAADGELRQETKNELYAHIGKTMAGITPSYRAYKDSTTDKYVAELSINGRLVCRASDTLKKRAMTRAAMTLWDNKAALNYVCNA